MLHLCVQKYYSDVSSCCDNFLHECTCADFLFDCLKYRDFCDLLLYLIYISTQLWTYRCVLSCGKHRSFYCVSPSMLPNSTDSTSRNLRHRRWHFDLALTESVDMIYLAVEQPCDVSRGISSVLPIRTSEVQSPF